MIRSFKELGISAPLLNAVEEMGFEEPTEVQSRAIPHILNRENLIVMSKTGSGKTAAFGISMLQMIDPRNPGPQGLILTPTRELAVQIDSDLKKLGKHIDHRTTAVFGQHSINVEIQELSKGISILTGTPGRVYDHISNNNFTTRNISFLVLDEADRMLDMGFIDQVERIIRTLPKDRITLLFSATIPPEVRNICRKHMTNPVTIEIESETKTVDTIEQAYYRVESNEKNTQLYRLLLVEQPESCMIFCNTRIAVDRVQKFLTHKGIASQALHGDIPQGKRLKTIQQFKQGQFHLLVATDVAARGLHIEGLSLVINYDVPVEKDSYIHRVGRTGRAGNSGRAISLVTGDDIMSLYEIEEHIGTLIPEAELPTEADFNKRKEEAGEWIQANSLKPAEQRGTRQPKPSTRSRAEGSRRKGGRKNPSRQGEHIQSGKKAESRTSAVNDSSGAAEKAGALPGARPASAPRVSKANKSRSDKGFADKPAASRPVQNAAAGQTGQNAAETVRRTVTRSVRPAAANPVQTHAPDIRLPSADAGATQAGLAAQRARSGRSQVSSSSKQESNSRKQVPSSPNHESSGRRQEPSGRSLEPGGRNQEPAARKPLIKRILQKILGHKDSN